MVRAAYRRTSRFERAGDDVPVERISSKQGFSQDFRRVLVRESASRYWYDSVCLPITNHLSNVHLFSGNAEECHCWRSNERKVFRRLDAKKHEIHIGEVISPIAVATRSLAALVAGWF